MTLSPQVVRLRPAPHCRTPVTAYSRQVEPDPHFLNWQQDPHGNFLARLVFPKPTRRFQLAADLVAELTVVNPFDFFLESDALQYPFRYADWLGEELHDRFMLPHFVAQDFHEVVRELNEAGYPFDEEWFANHFEFRFPQLGHVAYDGVDMELRQAIEPWHVLGEESGGSSTVRYVDSSVERLQVRIRNLTHPRHLVTCNGRRVPLHSTGVPGEFVAGVRYRDWQPPSCLHPTIGVHAPLVFDLVDLWSQRSLGGCTWHVAHPGGRNFERFPVNALEAESRRAARFFPIGHTGGAMAIPPPEHNRDYPMTLDLRRPVSPAATTQRLQPGLSRSGPCQ